MEEKLNGIVLNSVSFGENDKILTIFTLEKGVVSSKIKGVKKAGAKLKFASEPFCFAEFVFSASQNKRTVIGASLLDSFYPLREDLTAYYCGATVLEFIKRFVKEGIESKDAFMLTVNSLKELAYGERAKCSVLIKFLLEALRLAGYAISPNRCAKCGKEIENRVFFDVFSGSFICENCFEGKGREIKFSTLNTLYLIDNGKDLNDKECVGGLKLIEFFLFDKADGNLNALKELIKSVE